MKSSPQPGSLFILIKFLAGIFTVCFSLFIADIYPVAAASDFSEKVPVLMYHYIESAPKETALAGLYLEPDIFASQLAEIKKNDYHSIFVSELADSLRQNKRLARCSLALTFDDGYEDFYQNAFPLLKKYQIKSTIYIIVNALDKPGYLTKSQLKEIAASGLVEIGSHTFNHPDLRSKKIKDAIFEIKDSRAVLARISGQPVLTFAYPYGYFKPEDLDIVSSTYLGAVSVHPGSNESRSNLWLIRRLRPGDRSGAVFAHWLSFEF